VNQLHNKNSSSSPLYPQLVEGSTCLALVPFSQAGNSTPPVQGPASLLAEYHGLLGRHKSMILALMVAGALLGFAVTVGKLPVYRARTSLDIQNLNSDFMNMKDIAPMAGNDAGSSADSYVQTQIKLLQSDTLRARTTTRMMIGAASAPPLTRDDLVSQVRRALHLPGNQPLTRSELIKETAKNVVVKPLGATRLVEVTCDSWNAKFSAAYCNALTNEFSEQDREVRWNEAQKTGEWLTRQLADVRDSLSGSEKKLEAATGADAMVLHHGGDSVAGEKLDELQAELMRAQAARVAKQAQFETSSSASPDSLPMMLDNAEYRDYQTKLEDLRRQVAALVPPLTEDNPKVQHLRAQIAELASSLVIKKQNLMERMRNEFDEARHRENLLTGAYQAQERNVAGEQTREAQVSMLRHEVDSEQQLYQTLLQKVKEAGFASALQASTVRVVDAAQAPEIPIGPRRPISVLIGSLLGILVGVAGAFAKERTETTLRVPGDVARYLALPELGVIPSAKKMPSELPATRASLTTRVVALLGPGGDAGADRSNNVDMRIWKDHASLVTEAFRSATYSILLSSKQGSRAKVYVVSSPNVGEGKTTVTCNLGYALAQANKRVLLIDGDLRKPRLHKSFNVPNELGFRDLLQGYIDLETSPLMEYCRQTSLPNLSIITSGHGVEEPVSLLHSPRCQQILDFLADKFDIILIDSPPVMHMADARILAGQASGAILVFRSRVTNRETAARARDFFLNDGVKVIGTILNDFSPEKEGKTGYYNSYYAYRQDESPAESLRKGKL
jgi:succinoglycan biosynthesis transport protein ExoP